MKLSTHLIAMAAVTLSFFAAGPAGASIQKQMLLELTNDRNQELNYLSALFDKTSTPVGMNISVVLNGKTTSSTNFSLAEISSANGVIVASVAGRAAVILRGKLDSASGGEVTMKYLTNLVAGSYAECHARVRRLSDGRWQVVNAYTGQAVTRGHIQTWELGISAIVGICPTKQFESFDPEGLKDFESATALW